MTAGRETPEEHPAPGVPGVLHFGGNGHASARLDGARRALACRPGAPALDDVPYPGFEGRLPSPTLDAFLDAAAGFCRARPGAVLGYASGVGALIALGLRARGELAGLPLVLQGPVLWGLERRVFPRLMRAVPPARRLLRLAFASRAFQGHFAGKQFRRPLGTDARARFFDGYGNCAAFGDFFAWFTPGYLRDLERRFAARPDALSGVTVWLGGRDPVVGPAEVRLTGRALGVGWPVVTFPEWGHYPMIDEPEEWADALCRSLAGCG